MHESEPTYVYVKGEGWVPRTPGSESFFCMYTDVDGDIWEVHDRKPDPGERWTVLLAGEDILAALNWFTDKREPLNNIGKWEAHFANAFDHYLTFLPTT
jgi:hypothetical protein